MKGLNNPRILRALLPAIFLLVALALAGCARGSEPVVREKFLLDTLVTVRSLDRPEISKSKIERAIDAAYRRMTEAEKSLNIHDPKSGASKINKAAGGARPVIVSSDLRAAIAAGLAIRRETGGAYALTIGAATKLWSFEPGAKPPSPASLEAATALIDDDLIALDRRTGSVALAEQGMRLDLGGISKGFALDRAAEVLLKQGLKHTLVTSISSTKVLGPKPGGGPWLIGIQSPRPKTTPGLIGVIELKKGSISTSGDYQQFFTHSGRRYHHILDPATGRPATGFMSVTVVTDKSAARADALSTALAVAGRSKAMALAEETPGTDVIFIDGRGKPWVSSGLKGKIRDLVPSVR